MKVTDFEVKRVERSEIKKFVETWHYSRSINGVMSTYCFGLYNGDVLIGAMIYGRLGMANTWKKYAEKEEDILELRRLCCIDDTPKNTESYFIGHTLRWLKKNTNVKKIVSYADCNYGHEGIIYQATNFAFLGKTSKGKVIITSEGRQYHDKAVRTSYNGKLKPFAVELARKLEEGEAKYFETKGKNIYIKQL